MQVNIQNKKSTPLPPNWTQMADLTLPTSYVHYVTFNIMWALSVYLQVTCTTSLLAYCGFISIHTSYVHYVTSHTVVLSVYLPVTCTTSLLTYCGFVSIPTSYVHYVTFNILWLCQYNYQLRTLRHF
jgi:hypothetical protein